MIEGDFGLFGGDDHGEPYSSSGLQMKPGQLYVRDVGAGFFQRDVPIDNFIFKCENGDEFKLEFFSDIHIYVSWLNKEARVHRHETHKTIRAAMIRMAALIEGTLTWENFGD